MLLQLESKGMITELPAVGTNRLLDLLSDYVPDDLIDDLFPLRDTGGRRHALGAPQLWRVHLLAVLTSTHSLNLLAKQLPEQPVWRRFARLRGVLPSARMLHEFRDRIEVSGLRRINQHLLGRMIRRQGVAPFSVAVLDATDLPAATGARFKKKPDPDLCPSGHARPSHPQAESGRMVHWLQKAHPEAVAAHAPSLGELGAAGQLGDSSQRQ